MNKQVSPTLSRNLDETRNFAEEILNKISKESDHAYVLALSGDLGSGKTAFTKEFGALLGIPKSEITSPTFVIEKIYNIKHPFFKHLIHIDAYRLESPDELTHLGWDDLLSDNQNIILIEWPEKVSSIIPSYAQYIDFRFIDEHAREMLLRK